MTRFARAKGSKASNEKLPNEATPWHLIKQQLEENKNQAPLEKKTSVKELLKSEKDTCDSNVNENSWAEFDDNRPNLSNNTQKHKNSISNNKHKKSVENSQDVNTDHITSKNNKTKKLKKTGDTEIRTMDSNKNEFSHKKKQNINNLPPNEKESIPQDNKYSNFNVLSKRQKRNQKRKLETINNNNAKRFKTNTSSHKKTKEEKIKEKAEYKRRKPNHGVTKIMINGIETEIAKFDGFPIKKEDADRLTELKQKLIIKGERLYT